MKTRSAVCHHARLPFAFSLFLVACLAIITGCGTSNPDFKPYSALPSKDAKDAPLREADVVKIDFPGASTLDTVQTVRRDGKITLPVVGEVVAAGKTPVELQKELVKLYAKELVSSKEITVSVQQSAFPIFVTGAVMKPGKLLSDSPMTALEAIMESGGPDYTRANLKSVRIIRTQDNHTKNFTINLKGLENSTSIDIFYLQPGDIVYVPEKIVWF
ncbi:MAG TPA: polysaccharide biosynthesis/export family protein [Verrucomicrobiae bacterium]|jgi:polysaccharide export outer membrane protein|nr:polysaccharide biosynthesis/export family protein [Verrucomicrobiae bacterium]